MADLRRETPRVLLVEPHDDTRLLYTALFEDAGCAVHAVTNGKDATAVARHRLPDLVIMELVVPEGDGFAILLTLREEPLTADVPAIVVTSFLHFSAPERARHAGATVVLAKPILPDVLLAAAEDLLAATPSDRFTRRQLRRSLMTLQKFGSKLDQDAKDRVRALIDRLQIAVLAIDNDGHYVAASPGAELLTGYHRDELLAMTVFHSALGHDLPLAGRWDDFRSGQGDSSVAFIRDRSGQRIPVHTSFTRIVPGLYAAALATNHG